MVRARPLLVTFHIDFVSWFLARLAVRLGHLEVLPSVQIRTGLTQALQHTYDHVSRGFSMYQALVLEHFCHACAEGSHMRMSTGTIFDRNAYSRLRIEPDLWNSKVVIQFSWKEAAHINELEMRSFLSSFFWRSVAGAISA